MNKKIQHEKLPLNRENEPVIVLIGRRDTGKSFGKRFIIISPDIPIGTVISGTEAGNGFYGRVPKLLFTMNTIQLSLKIF